MMTPPRLSVTGASGLRGDRRRRGGPRRRRGVALLLVLLLISITLGLSYAAVRSQYTAIQIHSNYERNSDRRTAAHMAAITGMMMAIQRMHTPQWEGVDVPWGRPLGTHERFDVTYTTGDPSFREPEEINWDDPDYTDPYYDFPYRVTVVSTGSAANPENPTCVSRHRLRAVLRLVPRELAQEPAEWDEVLNSDELRYEWEDSRPNHPGELTSYRIYPGGATYYAEILDRDQRDVVRQPDPKTNPLGIYYRRELAKMYDNVTFRGTLVTDGGRRADVDVSGYNVNLLAVDLPALEGQDKSVRLPTVISAHDVTFRYSAQASVTGIVTAMDEFRKKDQQDDMEVTIQGRIAAAEIPEKDPEEDWLTITPEERTPVQYHYHWHNPQNTLYVPGDEGLRWRLLQWTENP